MCDYFAMCENAPDGVVSHPILGAVLTCQRCADRVGVALEADPERIRITVQDTPSGRLLARALDIMRENGATMGEAMDRAQFERDHNLLP